MEYFTLDEDSEVEEFVAEDPSYIRKVFWFELVEKAIRANSHAELVKEAGIAGISLALQLFLVVNYIQNSEFIVLGWTVGLALTFGTINVVLGKLYLNKQNMSIGIGKQFHEEVSISDDNERHHQLLELKRSAANLKQKIAMIVRHVFTLALISPIFDIIYKWTEIGKNERELRKRQVLRSHPQPSIPEIQLVQKNLKAALHRSYGTLIEAMLKFIPFALAQVFIYIHYCYYSVKIDEREEVALNEYGIRAYLIIWNMITISWSCTMYGALSQNYAKSLQFQDLREFGTQMHLSLPRSGIWTFYPLVNNFVSVVFRLYCIAILMSTLHIFTITTFFPILIFSFQLIMNRMPRRSRLRFENPTHSKQGLTTPTSDLINRWINIFCSHDMKFECHFHFAFTFIFFYALARIGWILASWTQIEETESYSYGNDDFGNASTIYGFAKSCQDEMPLPVQVPFLNSITQFIFKILTMITLNCSPRRNLFLTDFGVVILISIQHLIGLIYLLKSKILIFESTFPAQIAHRWWTTWLSQDMDRNDMFKVRKIILCLIISDEDIQSLTRYFSQSFSWCYIPLHLLRRNLNRQALESEMDKLWEKCEKEAQSGILAPTSARLEQLIERRKAIRNEAEVDVKLTEFCEFLIENFDLDTGTTLLIIYAVTNFDKTAHLSNSLRLSQINMILKN